MTKTSAKNVVTTSAETNMDKMTTSVGSKTPLDSSAGAPAADGMKHAADSDGIIRSLSLLDPILQFLTRATGQTLVPLSSIQRTIPPPLSEKVPVLHLLSLLELGILQVQATPASDTRSGSGSSNQTNAWRDELKRQWNQSVNNNSNNNNNNNSSSNDTPGNAR